MDVFFVLSGFVLAERCYDEDLSSKLALRAFAERRFARIYPLREALPSVGDRQEARKSGEGPRPCTGAIWLLRSAAEG